MKKAAAPRQLGLGALLDGSGDDPAVALAQRAGAHWLCGVDEAGRGPLAGPVVSGAVLIKLGDVLPPVADSKVLSAARRAALVEPVQQHARAWAVAQASVEEIDSLGILVANGLAMRRAVEQVCRTVPDAQDVVVIVDGRETVPGLAWRQHAVVDGDATCAVVAAASILAKEHRDALMVALETGFPGYGFAQHKGYGTKVHLQALRTLGVSPHHRKSFDPIRTFLAQGTWDAP